jgi:hypothetical protein
MRRKAELNPVKLKSRPIIAANYGDFGFVANPPLERPLSGSQTHDGF